MKQILDGAYKSPGQIPLPLLLFKLPANSEYSTGILRIIYWCEGKKNKSDLLILEKILDVSRAINNTNQHRKCNVTSMPQPRKQNKQIKSPLVIIIATRVQKQYYHYCRLHSSQYAYGIRQRLA